MPCTGKHQMPEKAKHAVRFVRDRRGRFSAKFVRHVATTNSWVIANDPKPDAVLTVDPGARNCHTAYLSTTGEFTSYGLVEDAERLLAQQRTVDSLQVCVRVS